MKTKHKMIAISMPDGSIWHVPLNFIAKHRAAYYAKRDGGTEEEQAQTFKEEVEYVMGDDFEGVDWISNNMNWDDLKAVAVKAAPVKAPNYPEWFRNAGHAIVEVEQLDWTESFAGSSDDGDGVSFDIYFDTKFEHPAMFEVNGAEGFLPTTETLPGIIKALQRMLSDLKELESDNSPDNDYPENRAIPG